MDYIDSILAIVAGILGVVAGYSMGYRSGAVAGELTAIKELRREHRRKSTSSRERGEKVVHERA